MPQDKREASRKMAEDIWKIPEERGAHARMVADHCMKMTPGMTLQFDCRRMA